MKGRNDHTITEKSRAARDHGVPEADMIDLNIFIHKPFNTFRICTVQAFTLPLINPRDTAIASKLEKSMQFFARVA